jgi:Fe-S cluster biogenesis protein NfuA
MSDSTASEQASALLDGLRQSLASDGYRLQVEPAGSGIHLTVRADSGTCSDCLVPKETFRGIVETMLQRGGLVVDKIDVTYPASGAH